MSRSYQPYASIAPSGTDNAYILALVPTIGNGLAAITSASELLIADRQALSTAHIIRIPYAPQGANCLISDDDTGQSLLCSSTDGTVATFDVRSQKNVAQFKIDRGITAIACRGPRIAIGTEYKSHQAIVSLWDARQNKKVWQNAENNDEITALQIHPSREHTVLAGSDDGLISLFDTRIAEEDDSLVQVINHGPIYKAGFVGENRIFALSSDQNFSVHPVSTPGDDEDPPPTLIGDLRPLVPCQYVVDVVNSAQDYVIVAGTNIDASRIDMFKLEHATNVDEQPSLDPSSRHVLEPAHGEEVVRAIVVDEESGVIFTAGEDGYIRAARPLDDVPNPETKTPKSSKLKKGSDSRYKPY